MSRSATTILLAFLALVGIALLVFPIEALVHYALLHHATRSLRGPTASQALKLSLRTVVIAGGCIVLLGTPIAALLDRASQKWSSVGEAFTKLPIVLPPSAAGLGLLLAFGHQGFLGRFLASHQIHVPFTTLAVIIAQVFVGLPLFIGGCLIGLRSVPSILVDQARLDGATELQAWGKVILPIASPAIADGYLMAMARALGEFGATILFAGNLQGITQTIPLAIYLGFEDNLDQAVALSVVLLTFALLALTTGIGLRQYVTKKIGT